MHRIGEKCQPERAEDIAAHVRDELQARLGELIRRRSRAGGRTRCRMKCRSMRAPMPFRIAKLNTSSGTSERSVVYARLMARTLISPGQPVPDDGDGIAQQPATPVPRAGACCAIFGTVRPRDVPAPWACRVAQAVSSSERLAIVVAGARDDVRRQVRRRRLLVPVQRFQIVAHELLVETRRTDAGFVGGNRPEARRVRRQHLVDQHQIAGLVDAELELGVGDDDVARAGMRGGEDVERQRDAPDCSRRTRGRPGSTMASKSTFSSCWPAGAFDAGVNMGSGSASAMLVPAAERCRTPPRAACNPCSPSRSDSRAPRPRSAAPSASCTTIERPASCAALVGVRARVLDLESRSDGSATMCAGLLEPELGDLGEHCALERDRIGQHDIERRQPIGGDDEHMVRIDIVDVPHLALVDLFQAADASLEQRRDCESGSMRAGFRLLPLWVRRSAIVAGRVG